MRGFDFERRETGLSGFSLSSSDVGRQCTEFESGHCSQIFNRMCSSVTTRRMWKRSQTEAAPSSSDYFRRFVSAPPTAGALAVLEPEQAEVIEAIDMNVNATLAESVIEGAIFSAVVDCSFCVTVADPRSDDTVLMAVSKGFEKMTGYKAEEMVGRNCRMLNIGCQMEPWQRAGLRKACKTGEPFTTVLQNRKKTGELFSNLLDIRGLTIAENLATGEELWFLIGIQADVSSLNRDEIVDDRLMQVARRIRRKLVNHLALMGVSAALNNKPDIQFLLESADGATPDMWRIASEVKWKSRFPDQRTVSLDELPLLTQRHTDSMEMQDLRQSIVAFRQKVTLLTLLAAGTIIAFVSGWRRLK